MTSLLLWKLDTMYWHFDQKNDFQKKLAFKTGNTQYTIMITRPILFVLGAGASAHLGYPTGRGMLDIIIENLTTQTLATEPLLQMLGFGHTGEQIDQFVGALARSGQDSVDAFLEYRPEFMEIGKLAIAQTLIPYEDEDRLFIPKNNWYLYLYNHLKAPLNKFADNAVSFITFNYDRSLEQFLFTALLNAYGATWHEVSEVLDQIPIIHVHGQLGDLPWKGGLRYENVFDDAQTKARAKDIKIIHENIDADAEFGVAQNMIDGTPNVHFLGFGYHETNMKRLGFSFDSPKEVRGSSFGLTEHEKRELMGRYTKLKLFNQDWNCYEYVRNRVNWN